MHHIRAITANDLIQLAGNRLVPKRLGDQFNPIQINDRIVTDSKTKNLMPIFFKQGPLIFKYSILTTCMLIAIVTQKYSHVSHNQSATGLLSKIPNWSEAKCNTCIKSLHLHHCVVIHLPLAKLDAANAAPTHTNPQLLLQAMQHCPKERH